jgi:hypothetical protein
MADALGILERSLNPETLLSLFSGGELQVCTPLLFYNATCSAADRIVCAVQPAFVVLSRWDADLKVTNVQERFAAGLASHLSRSLPVQRSAAVPSAPQHQQQPMDPLPGSQSSLPTAGVSVYGDGMSAYMADDSMLDVSRGGNRDALDSRCTKTVVACTSPCCIRWRGTLLIKWC